MPNRDIKKPERSNWKFGLTFKDFRHRLKEMGLPASRNAIINWEKKGWLKFQLTKGGWRKFDSWQDIDDKINYVMKVRSEELPEIRKQAAMKRMEPEDQDNFTVIDDNENKNI